MSCAPTKELGASNLRPTNRVAQTSVEVTDYGFGAASMGNLYAPISDQMAAKTVDAAWCAGLRYFDTAPHYGFGLSERRLGDYLRGKEGFTLSSKVGRLLVPDSQADVGACRYSFRSPMPFTPHFDYSYDGVMRSFEDSLQRLGLQRIDILYVHDIGQLTHGEEHRGRWRQLFTGGYRALEELRSAGVVGAIGIGANECEACLDAMNEGRFDLFLLAGRYTLLEQDALDLMLPRCVSEGSAVVVGGPFNSGILASGVRGGGELHYDYEPAPVEIIHRVGKLEAICSDFNVPLPAAALQFPGAHPAVVSVIAGIGSPQRVHSMAEYARIEIPEHFWDSLRTEGLIRADAPTPSAPFAAMST